MEKPRQEIASIFNLDRLTLDCSMWNLAIPRTLAGPPIFMNTMAEDIQDQPEIQSLTYVLNSAVRGSLAHQLDCIVIKSVS